MIAYWRDIWKYLDPSDTDRIHLRRLCHLFNDSLGPTTESTKGRYTEYPHPNHPSLRSLFDRCKQLFEEDPRKAPTIFFIKEGDHEGGGHCLHIDYPMKIFGAGRNKTILRNTCFSIEGTKEDRKCVVVTGLTVTEWDGCGFNAEDGLSFVCDSVTFTRCTQHGLHAENTKGRLINCVATQCGQDGIYCSWNALIELEGSQTKVHGNVTSGDSDRYTYGLHTDSSSIIHLLSPLTKESVSTNNHNGQNYGTDSYGGGSGCIETVDSFDDESDDDN